MLATIIMVNHITWISRWLEMLTSRLFIQQLAHTNNSTKTAKLWKLLVTDPLTDCRALSYWPSHWMLITCSLAAAPTPAVAMWHHLSTLTMSFSSRVPYLVKFMVQQKFRSICSSPHVRCCRPGTEMMPGNQQFSRVLMPGFNWEHTQ